MIDSLKIENQQELVTAVTKTQRYTLLGLIVMVVLISSSAFELVRLRRESDVKHKELQLLDLQLQGKTAALKQLEEKQKATEVAYQKVLAIVNETNKSIAQLVAPKASATQIKAKAPNGQQLYDFLVWLDLPQPRRAEIESVDYFFDDPTMINKMHTSANPENGFAVSYRGWGAFQLVTITVHLKNRQSFHVYFDMDKALGWE